MLKQILTGFFYPDLQNAFLEKIDFYQRESPHIPLIVLAPEGLLLSHLKKILTKEKKGLANIFFFTLSEFAQSIVLFNLGQDDISFISQFLQQAMLEQIAQKDLNQDSYFFSIARKKGFLNSLCETIRELKLHGISSQDMLNQASLQDSPKYKDIARIFSIYEKKTKQKKLYDLQETVKAASTLIGQDDRYYGFPLILYGFWQLCPLEKKFLEACFSYRDTTAFVPCCDLPFYKNIQRLQDWFLSLGFERLMPKSDLFALPPLLKKLRESLFAEVLPCAANPEEKGVEIFSSINHYSEVQEIEEKIFTQCENGYALDSIGILISKPENYLSCLEDTLASSKVPFYSCIDRVARIHESRLFLEILQAFTKDTLEDSLFTIAHSPCIHKAFFEQSGIFPFSPVDWLRISRELALKGNYSQWEKKLEKEIVLYLERISSQASLQEGDIFRFSERIDSSKIPLLKSFLLFIQFWHQSLLTLEKQKSYNDLIDKIFSLYDQVCVFSAAREKTKQALASLIQLDKMDIAVSVLYFSEIATSILENTYCNNVLRNGICLSDLERTLGIPFSIVILPGLVEKEFPPSSRTLSLITDKEKKILNQSWEKKGLFLGFSSDRFLAPKLLYHLTLSSALNKAFLSFPRIETSTNQEKMPSIYLLETASVLSGIALNFSQFWKCPFVNHLMADPFSHTEILSSWLYDLCLLKKEDKSAWDNLLKRYPLVKKSQENRRFQWIHKNFTCFDGVLRDISCLRLLQKKYSLLDYPVDPRLLELYSLCPFRFFMKYILRFSSFYEPASIARISQWEQKKIISDILSHLYNREQESEVSYYDPVEENQTSHSLKEVVRFVFSCKDKSKEKEELLWEVEEEKTCENLEYYLASQSLKDPDSSPVDFQINYGCNGNFSCTLELQEDTKISFRGYFDQISYNPIANIWEGIHYYSGKPYICPKPNSFNRGETLHLAVDLLALQKMYPDALLYKSMERYIGAKGILAETYFSSEEFSEKKQTLQKICQNIVYGIENGFFFPVPSREKCMYCPYLEACGPFRGQIYESKQDDPRIDFFKEIKER
ncbi:MAG: PD-(D/E)XK nuclease family protein [Candidatus Brocadiae bacterium]|nr:PD-(D/E)XK nuclease family protein [Candidatus Brocadiia bacterium]